VVLDEPNSNLDDQGEQALFAALRQLKARGATVVVVSHRMNILSEIDALLLMADGAVKALGPRDQVLREIQAAQQKAHPSAQAARTASTTPVPEPTAKLQQSESPEDSDGKSAPHSPSQPKDENS